MRAGKTNKSHLVATKETVSIVIVQFSLTHSLLYVLLPWLLARETTWQHEMAREICFHLLLEEGWNI